MEPFWYYLCSTDLINHLGRATEQHPSRKSRHSINAPWQMIAIGDIVSLAMRPADKNWKKTLFKKLVYLTSVFERTFWCKFSVYIQTSTLDMDKLLLSPNNFRPANSEYFSKTSHLHMFKNSFLGSVFVSKWTLWTVIH